MEWLAWPGWGGVSGLVALIALVAAVVVTYLELRIWWLTPRTLKFSGSTLAAPPSSAGVVELKFRFEIGGARALHEVTVYRLDGRGATQLGEPVPVLETRDGYIERETAVLVSDSPVYFVVTWTEPTRYGVRLRAIRRAWTPKGRPMEWWTPYRWPYWPRAADGRWLARGSKRLRGGRGMFPSRHAAR